MHVETFMLIMVGCMAIAFVALLICCLAENGKYFLTWLAILLMSGLLFFAAPAQMHKQPYERPHEPYVTHEIMCLADNNLMSTRFYLYGGYINEEHHYLYGYKTSAGGMKTQKVKADTAMVFFDDDVIPCAKWYEETRQMWFLVETRITCDIYVPTDSLAVDYTIDLQ